MRRLAFCCALLPACAGCLLVYTKEETLRKDESRRPVTFESDTGARLFAAAVEKQLAKPREVGSQNLVIPFLTYITVSSKLSEAAAFNDEMTACDTDHNGVISDGEAVAFHKMINGDSPLLEGEKVKILARHGEQKEDGKSEDAVVPAKFETPLSRAPR
jgi:hypothetical protein